MPRWAQRLVRTNDSPDQKDDHLGGVCPQDGMQAPVADYPSGKDDERDGYKGAPSENHLDRRHGCFS